MNLHGKSKKLTEFLIFGSHFENRHHDDYYWKNLINLMNNLSDLERQDYDFRSWFDKSCEIMQQENLKKRKKKY